MEEGHDWHERLEYSNKGELLATVQNLWLILRYDPALSGKIWNDLFSMRRMCCGPFLWNSKEGERGWSDDDDAGLRYFFETVYHLTGRAKIDDALRMAAAQNARDPVVDYLNSLHWDGKPRLDTLFIDYLGARGHRLLPRSGPQVPGRRGSQSAAAWVQIRPSCHLFGRARYRKEYFFTQIGAEMVL